MGNSKLFLAVFLACLVLGLVLPLHVTGSIIDPATIQQINPNNYPAAVEWDASRDIGDKYWSDRGELIGAQGKITDAMTGKTMLGLEGLLLRNDAKGTKGNASGEDYEIKFQINPALTGKARVYVLLGIRDVFQVDPDDWLQGRLNDNTYSPQMDVSRFQGDRKWIGLDYYGVPIGTVFNRILRRPAPDGRPMAFPCRDGVGEEYFAFYHDFNAGEWVSIFGAYSGGSNYYVFTEMAPPAPPPIWTSVDIGAAKTGDTQYNAAISTWDIYSDGADIWGTTDAFRYVYTDETGDFAIQGRLTGLVNANDWAKAGFMVRESTAANSMHASLFARGANDYIGIQYRASTGGGSSEGATLWAAPAMPKWFKVQRAGNVLTAFRSDDAITWTQHGQLAPVPTGTLLVGMAMTSHDANRIGGGTFANVYVTGKGMVFAHAGKDQSVDQLAADATFVLDGTASLDANTYLWEQISPATPLFTIADPTQAKITLDGKSVVILNDTTFVFRLTVTNTASGATQTATVRIFVRDKEQANAGPDQQVGEGVQVFLNGTASTGDIAAYEWTQVAGPAVPSGIFGVDTPTPHFWTDNYIGDTPLTFRLTITGTDGGKDSDDVVITALDQQRALANAGPDQVGYEMRSFQLDARGTTTRDGVPWDAMKEYKWEQTGGPSVYKFKDTNKAVATFIAPEIPFTQYVKIPQWPPTRTLTFRVTVKAPNDSTNQDTVVVTLKDAEFETVFYREHEDFDFHNSLEDGRWYPKEAEFGAHYCWGKVAREVNGMPGRFDPGADYQWLGWGGWHDYRDGVSLGTDGFVQRSSGTDWKCGWINPGGGDYWKYTFELPTGSDKAWLALWLATDNSWHGNARAYLDFEEGNTSPVGHFRVCRRGWDNYAPHLSPRFQVNPGRHKIMIDAYGAGEPNYARFEFHVPKSWANIANAGPDKGALSGELVTLNGTASQATNTTYAWEQVFPDDPPLVLTNVGQGVFTFVAPTVAAPTNFIFRLTVTGSVNSSVDFASVMVIPANKIIALFADQRTGRDATPIDWGNRDRGGAVWGSDYVAGNWGALPAGRSLSSNVVVHHYNDAVEADYGYKNVFSEIAFNLPDGFPVGDPDGRYYAYIRAAHRGDGSGNSSFIRVNEIDVMGRWPEAVPPNDNYRLCEDSPYGWEGTMDWHWGSLQASTIKTPLKAGDNALRIYARESRCNEGRPYTWDAVILSTIPLDKGNPLLLDAIARAAQIPVGVISNAGADFTIYSGETGALDGTATIGASYWRWFQTAGPAVAITDSEKVVATFVAPTVAGPQVLTFRLLAGHAAISDDDYVNVTVLPPGTAPAMPTNLRAESVEMGIRLTWDPVPGAVTYKILRRESWKWWPFDTLVAEKLNACSFIDRNIPVYMDELYDYTVLAVNAFGESTPAYPVYKIYALSANHALRPDANPIAMKLPGWWNIYDMKNRVREEYGIDSWQGVPSPDDWWGYMWPQKLYLQEIHFYPGNIYWDGGWWTSLKVQFTKDGSQWYDIPNLTITPPYAFTPDTPDGRSPALGQPPYIRRHILKFPRVEALGIRIYGAPGGVADFTSMVELELYGVPGPEGFLYAYAGTDFSADEGTVATLNGSDSSDPLAVKFHWEQVTGAGGKVTQVDMTSAFNKDVIWAKGEVLGNQDPFEPGGANFVYTSNPDVGPYVLPADGKVGPYQLGPYTGRNCLLLSDQQRSGVVPVTPGNYGSIGVVFAGASGNHMTNLILNYANGNSPAIPFQFSDWFFRADVERVVEETYRVNRNDGSSERNDQAPPAVGGPNLYHRVLPVDSTRTLVSVTFSGFPGSGAQTGGVFAINLGPEVPVLNLVNPDSAVCTFSVPEITHDQTVTFKLTVWDSANKSATDEVDVLLVDTDESRANAGADITASSYTSVTLDAGQSQNAVWWTWEQIGGTPALALWNANQAKATIIAPDIGLLTFKLTIGAANGTVSSDTVTVAVMPAAPSVPASGYLQDVLMCGANYSSRFTSNMDINRDHLAANGGQANQRPNAGDPINTSGESFADGPAVWTAMHRDHGQWFHHDYGCNVDNFIAYFHVYIISPEERGARCILRHDDEMRCWNNGSLSFGRDGWDGGGEVSSDFTLYRGFNSMTFKLHEGGGGNYLAVRFTDTLNRQYSDLRYVLNYNDTLPVAKIGNPPEERIVRAGDLMYLDGRPSQAGTYSWEQVFPQEPKFALWFDDSDTPILGAPMVDEDTNFFIRLWVTTGTGVYAYAVKVTVATREVPGPVTGVTGEWAGDVGAVLRWESAAHASRYNIRRADSAAGPYTSIGTASTTMFVDPGPLSLTGTYYFEIEPANILNVGPGIGRAVITRNPNIANAAKSDLAVPIVGQPAPQGGGSRDITLMKDGIVSGQNYDTFDANTPNPGSLQGEETFEFFGYLFDRPLNVHSLVYYTGGVFGDGGWWTKIGVQVTRDGVTWQDASGVVSGPVYNTEDSGAGRGWNEKYIFSIIPDTVTGVRIAGHAGGSMRFVSIAELEVYGDIGGLSVNAGADATVKELATVTLDGSATTGATAFKWTQVSGPTAVITNPTSQNASFTAPGVVWEQNVTFRLTASSAQWSAFDDVSFVVRDQYDWHLYRYTADFDGRSAAGALIWAGGTWTQGYVLHDLAQFMRGVIANKSSAEGNVANFDFFFQDTSQSQSYRPATLNPFDVRYLSAGEVDPFIGYTTRGDWWNYTFGKIGKPYNIETSFPAAGVMYLTVLACTGHGGGVTAEVLLDEVVVTTITFPYTAWGNFGWHPGTGSFLVTAGKHTIRIHLTQNGWDFCKFRFDLAIAQVQQILPLDGAAMIKWSDVGRNYTLQEADTPKGPWTDIYGPTTETSLTAPIPPEKMKFYRIKVE